MTVALEGGEWSAALPGRTLPPGKTPYLFYRMVGGPQGRSGRAENLVPTGIRSRTIQPVAQSVYRLSYLAHNNNNNNNNFYKILEILFCNLQRNIGEKSSPCCSVIPHYTDRATLLRQATM